MFINDRRVDLTENEDFRQRKLNKMIDFLFKTDSKKIISPEVSLILGDRPNKEVLLFTGSVEKIRNLLQYEKYISGQYCDCCGTRLMPWENGLCSKCNEYLLDYVDGYENGTLPWEKQEINRTIDDIFV